MTSKIIQPLGVTDDGDLVANPFPELSRMVIGSTGSAKTTSVVMPTLQALIADTGLAIVDVDPKHGECFEQFLPVAAKYGRPIGCIDDTLRFGADNPYRVKINPFHPIISANKNNPGCLGFTIKAITHSIIPEVADGGRNFSFRENPRNIQKTFIRAQLEIDPENVRPGILYEVMADPYVSRQMREEAAASGSPALQARAQVLLDMEDRNPEEYFKHLSAALSPLEIYEPGSVLNDVGKDVTHTPEELITRGGYIHIVSDQRYAGEIGVHNALQLQCFSEAKLAGCGGKLLTIVDEMCSPAHKKEANLATVQRAYKKSNIWIAQTFTDVEEQYGKAKAKILRDNCAVIQYLSFSEEDAEKVSKMMGEEISVSRTLNVDPQRLGISGSITTGKQPVMTKTELMNLPPHKQVVFIRGHGWFILNKLYQNQIVPTAEVLGTNTQEGAPMPVDPKVQLPVPEIGVAS